ncbi:MAG: DUF5117 domain-containing protein, partial [Bacteroidota bacterium]|nr:DUF5117 domain-containing protein [Bacteroidota bacterium]
MKRLSVLFLLLLLGSSTTRAQDLPTIESKTSSMEKMEGFYSLYWDDAAGKVWLEIDRFGEDFMYQVALVAGLGSNDIGLDRNQLGPGWVVRFERRGPKVLMVAPNLDYRAMTDNESERASVAEAFASGVLHGFDIGAVTDGRVLVDATSFIVRDAHGVAGRLRRSNQGSFSVEASRSVPWKENTRSFPRNTEMEALITFASDNPGSLVGSVAAAPQAVALRQRNSFIELPD